MSFSTICCVLLCVTLIAVNDSLVNVMIQQPLSLLYCECAASYCTISAISFMFRRDVNGSICSVLIAVPIIYALYQYYRRTRKKKPSKVLGMVTRLGDKLVVVPVKGENV